MAILQNLNDKQKEAVRVTNGPLLILAGPGSGKTKTLTHRIAYLISQGVNPYNILAVTFTNKAASEMKNRVRDLLETNPKLSISDSQFQNNFPTSNNQFPTIGTFHSVCVRILRAEARKIDYTSDFSIYDDQDQISLIKKIIKDFEIDEKQLSPQKVAALINKAKDNLVSQDEYELSANNSSEKKIAKIYQEYQKKLKQINAFDFGDLIMQVVFLFAKNEHITEKYQSRFKYILVDEYQDTNTAQYKWLKSLAKKHKNICVVGDDAQAIYSWRNADFQNILNFTSDWPQAKVIKLEQNYRSTKNIVSAASTLIKNNSMSYEKELWTENKEGEPIAICQVENEYEEAEFIIGKIEQLIQKYNYTLNNFVVLYRTNAQSRAIEQMFLRYDIPYKIVGGLKFYQRQEVKDVIAWIRLLKNGNDEASLQRLQKLNLSSLKENLNAEIKNKKQAIEFILNNLNNKLQKNPTLTELVKYTIKISNFEKILRDGTERGEERWQNVQELLSVTQDFNQINIQEALNVFLENATLTQEADIIEEKSQLVHLMTLHMAKGLEFPVVFIAGCEEGLLPHSSSMMKIEELEEERRLFYVGLTRAKDMAYTLFTQRRMVWGNIQYNRPSSFLRELPEENIQFKPLDETLEEEEIIEID